MTKPTDAKDQHGEAETIRRRDEAVRRALNTPPKPYKDSKIGRQHAQHSRGRQMTKEQQAIIDALSPRMQTARAGAAKIRQSLSLREAQDSSVVLEGGAG